VLGRVLARLDDADGQGGRLIMLKDLITDPPPIDAWSEFRRGPMWSAAWPKKLRAMQVLGIGRTPALRVPHGEYRSRLLAWRQAWIELRERVKPSLFLEWGNVREAVSVGSAAVSLCFELHGRKSEEFLLACLGDADRGVMCQAAYSLGKMRAPMTENGSSSALLWGCWNLGRGAVGLASVVARIRVLIGREGDLKDLEELCSLLCLAGLGRHPGGKNACFEVMFDPGLPGELSRALMHASVGYVGRDVLRSRRVLDGSDEVKEWKVVSVLGRYWRWLDVSLERSDAECVSAWERARVLQEVSATLNKAGEYEEGFRRDILRGFLHEVAELILLGYETGPVVELMKSLDCQREDALYGAELGVVVWGRRNTELWSEYCRWLVKCGATASIVQCLRVRVRPTEREDVRASLLLNFERLGEDYRDLLKSVWPE
jgi:hypothetical protein